jgi:ATP-dependent helicase/nuclease subunit A
MTLQSTPQEFAYALDGAPCTREAFYAIACDPQRNVVVQACAGAGKTWMLVSRILRALVEDSAAHVAAHAIPHASLYDSTQTDGAQPAKSPLKPQDILAITFTKKAAGEMRQRLQEWLNEYAGADDATLEKALLDRGISRKIGPQPKQILLKQLSNLKQSLLDSNRTVQIRTFHSWFAALLRSAPLAVLEQLNLPAQYELLEDDSEAVALVWRRFYALLQGDAALRSTYYQAVAAHSRFNVDKALHSALDKRVEFGLADAAGVVASSIRPFGQVYPEMVGLGSPLDVFAAGSMQRQQLAEVAAILGRYDGKIPQKAAADIERALTDDQLPDALAALVVQAGTPRKFSDKIPGIDQVRAVQEQCVRINAALLQHAAWLHQHSMAQLSRALIACFAQLKRERGWVDMGDIERAALHLLSDSVLSGWVQQRLDAQTRHLLIDEFQDTNPLQWQALQAWLASYAGAGGGSGISAAPSVFIVGDPKQSIYRFRRAEPQVFIAATDFVRDALGGVVLSCDHTRRNARGVLAAVNGVMQAAADTGYEGYRPHTTESKLAGQVLRLPLVPAEPGDDEADPTVWRDTLTTPRDEAEEHIRTRECAQAARWVAQHLANGDQGQPLPAGQVMVLSRKRDRLQRMAAELQQLGIASQISEKTQLMQHCAVQDVVALVDALTSPTHDLSLARALKSPLFSCTDAQLASIAQAARTQGCSWLNLLLNTELLEQVIHALQPEIAYKLHADLTHFYNASHTLPPHDALAAIYQHADVIARFMAAAPAADRTAVATQLQALLTAALDVDGGRFLTSYAWVRALKAGHVRTPTISVKSANAVQLLTVHGAKGLEAHTVLLLDANAQAEKSRSMDVLIDWPAQHAAPTTFAFLASESAPPACVQDALQREQQARAREETNALYVVMTRAQHTLALSAHAVRTTDATSPWQRFAALGDGVVDEAIVQGDAPQGSAMPNADLANSNTQHSATGHVAAPLHTTPRHDSPAADVLRTSGTAHAAYYPSTPLGDTIYIKKMPFQPVEPAQPAIKLIVIEQTSVAARQGLAMHRLLELYHAGVDLQSIAHSVGAQFQLTAAQADAACAIAQRITQGPAAWVWDSAHIDWQANEVELLQGGDDIANDNLNTAADVSITAATNGQTNAPVLLRLDRLVKHRATQTWWVLDYKSANAPQQQTALRLQLAQYQQAVQAAHPGTPVRAAFITGEGQLIEL